MPQASPINRMSEISAALTKVREQVINSAIAAGRDPDEVTLIAVTKNYPSSDLQILKSLGVNDFGENRDTEGSEKSLATVGTWHFQGGIQSNKINSIARWADVVHSLDNSRHIDKFAGAVAPGKVLKVFLQVALDNSEGRSGVQPAELDALAENVMKHHQLQLLGLMAVAPLGEDPESAFQRLEVIHRAFKDKFPDSPYLSAGMSGDFEGAISHGATHIRVGSSILGSRMAPL